MCYICDLPDYFNDEKIMLEIFSNLNYESTVNLTEFIIF